MTSATRGAVRAVLFDVVGTLIETKETIGTVYSRRAAPHGVALPAWRLDDAFRRILSSAPPRVFPEVPTDDVAARERGWWRAVVRSTFLAADSTVKFDDYDRFFSALFDFYATSEAWSLRPAAAETLSTLRGRGLRTGVVSNFDQRLPKLLQALEIYELLDVVMTPSACAVEKPAPRIFELALAELGLPAEAVVYVGDDPEKDAAGAKRVGMRSIDVRELGSLERLPARIEDLNQVEAR